MFISIMIEILLTVALIVSVIVIKEKKIKIILAIILAINVVFVVTVAVNYYLEEPVFMLKGEENVTIEYGSVYQDMGVTATWHDKNILNQVTVINNINEKKLGNNTIEYILKHHHKEIKLVRHVTIQDTTKPEITLLGKTQVQINQEDTYLEPGYRAKDSYDGDMTKEVDISKEMITDTNYNLIYTVQDSSGNIATTKRQIEVIKSATGSTANTDAIYLTFDDGPSSSITPKLLDLLKQENVKATFFILNYDISKEYLIQRIVQEGHTIAIHGFSHDYKQIYRSEEMCFENITKLQEKIMASTGVNTKLVRFPGGSSNTVSKYNPGVMSRMTKMITKKGYRYFDWNVSSEDAGGARTKEQVYQNVITGLKKNRANVVLMHDFGGNYKTLDAVKDIIAYGRQNGYTFDKIRDNTPDVHHKVAN